METVQPFGGAQVYIACQEGIGHTPYTKVFGELAGNFLKDSKGHTSHLKSKIWYVSVEISTNLIHRQVNKT